MSHEFVTTFQGSTIDGSTVELSNAEKHEQKCVLTLLNVTSKDVGNYTCTFWFDNKSSIQGYVLLDVFSESFLALNTMM